MRIARTDRTRNTRTARSGVLAGAALLAALLLGRWVKPLKS